MTSIDTLNARRVEELQVIVLDMGTKRCKAGFAGDDAPTFCFPTMVSRKSSDSKEEVLVGNDADSSLEKTTYPISRCVPNMWEDMMYIWNYMFYNEAKVPPEDCVVLLTEPILQPRAVREYIAGCLLTSFQVAGLNFGNQATMALFTKGLTSGLVLDSGETVTRAIAVNEGYALPHTLSQVDLAGKDVTIFLTNMLVGICDQHKEIETIKERCCCVRPDCKDEEEAAALDSTEVPYYFQDGTVLPLTQTLRTSPPEILFDPRACEDVPTLQEKSTWPGIQSLIKDTLLSVDPGAQKDCAKKIMAVGGSASFPSFGQRLAIESQKLLSQDGHDDLAQSIKVLRSEGANFLVWTGASIAASLGSVKWCTPVEFGVDGAEALDRVAL